MGRKIVVYSIKIKEQTRKLGADSTLVRQDDADVVWIWFLKSINKGVQEVRLTLYNWKGGKFMKVELQIKETYEEEKLIVQAPQPTEKVQKVI